MEQLQVNFGIIVQARTGSTRLKKKMLLPFGENNTLLGYILSKIKAGVNLPLVLATSLAPGDQVLGEIAEDLAIPVFYGSENDVLNRFVSAAVEHKFTHVIRICADNPFISIAHINELIDSFRDSWFDYLSYAKKDGTPVMKSHLGYFAEAVKVSALEKAELTTTSSFYHEHVTNFIYENKSLFSVSFLPVPDELDRDNYRLTLDTEQDYNMMFKLEEFLREKYNGNFGPNEILKAVETLELNDSMVNIINENKK